MDTVHCLIEYLEEFPPEAGAIELKNQLSAFTHQDLRAACSRLNLPVSKRQNKKGGFISVLVSYWKATTTVTSVPQMPKASIESPHIQQECGMELPHDVVQFVQLFPPHGHVEELQSQLDACRSRTLRSACVLLELHPKKSFTKQDFLGLLVNYWQDSSAVTPRVSRAEAPHAKPRVSGAEAPHATTRVSGAEAPHATTRVSGTEAPHATPRVSGTEAPHATPRVSGAEAPHATPKAPQATPKAPQATPKAPQATPKAPHATPRVSRAEKPNATPKAPLAEKPNATPREVSEAVHAKRPRTEEGDVKKTPKKKKKALGRKEDPIEEKTVSWAASLEKAKVVKEWASAIEILSRVDGSAASIESIRKLINGVVNSEL